MKKLFTILMLLPLAFYAQAQNTPTSCQVTATSDVKTACVGGAVSLKATLSSVAGTNNQIQLVTNGGFTAGNTGFSSDYVLNNTGTGTKTYTIGINANTAWAWLPTCESGNGNMLIANGGSNADDKVWKQSITVTTGKTYTVKFYASGLSSTKPARLSLRIGGTPVGDALILAAASCRWTPFTATWVATTSGTVDFSIHDLEVSDLGNDFAIDDVSITTEPTYGYKWAGANGFTSSEQNPSIQNLATSATGLYTVTATSNAGCTATATISLSVVNCTASTATCTTTVTATSNAPLCQGNTLNLGASGDGAFQWTGPSGFTSSIKNPTFAGINPNQAGVYSVKVITPNGCIGTATTSVVVNAAIQFTASSNGKVCAGGTILLFESLVTGEKSWTGPNGFTSTLQNPTIPNATLLNYGIYKISINSNGCTATATTVVQVNPNPTITVSSNSPVCAGKSISLSSTSGTNTSVSWSGIAGFTSQSINPSIANATTAMSGVYTAKVVNNETGCTNAVTTSVAVTVCTTATTATCAVQVGSNTPVCTGSNILLSSNGTWLSRSWTGPASFVSTTQNPSIPKAVEAMSGVYIIKVTAANGCTASATVSVVVKSCATTATATVNTCTIAVTAESSKANCVGGTATLKANSQATGLTYAWTGPAGFSSTLANPSISNLTDSNGGTYTIKVSNASSCTASATVALVVSASPIVAATSNSPLCDGGTLKLSATGGSQYQWAGVNTYSSSNQNPTISNATVARNGVYTVTVTNVAGCTATATITILVVKPSAPQVLATNVVVCAGDSAIVKATTSNGYINWYTDKGALSTVGNTLRIKTSLPGSSVYYATATIQGCVSPQTPVTIKAIDCCADLKGSVACAANNTYEFTFTITNTSGHSISQFALYPTFKGVTLSQNLFTQNIAVGATATQTITISGQSITSVKAFCVKLAVFEIANCAIKWSCLSEQDYCFSVPDCQVTPLVKSNVCNLQVDILNGDEVQICASDSMQLIAISNNNKVKYQWFPATGLSNPNVKDPTASPKETTIYSVVITDPTTGCTDTASVILHVIQCGGGRIGSMNSVSTESQNLTEMKVFPNPTQADITVQAPAGMDWKQVFLTTISGVKLAEKTNTQGTNSTQFSLNNQPAGTYLIYLKTEDNRVMSKKVVRGE